VRSPLTTVYVPIGVFGTRYHVFVSGARVVSKPGASRLVLRTLRGAAEVRLGLIVGYPPAP
jgi:hypothetical protein